MKYIKTYEALNGKTFQEWLKVNPQDINTTETISCNNSNLIDLNGIENFINLKILFCSNNQLKQLPDLSKLNNLKYLVCDNNKLTQLPDLSNLNNLKKLFCSNNQLTELPDLSNLNNLTQLYCHNNQLPYDNLDEYLEWHKKKYPWIWNAKNYNM